MIAPRNKNGFTILELLIVLAITIILFTLLIIMADPAGTTADARNRKREADINALLNIVYRNIADNGGTFTCGTGSIPTSTTNLSDNNPSVGDYDIAGCLVPAYISLLSFDPKASSAQYTNNTDYDLQYSISMSTTTGRITISAQNAEQEKTISVTR